MARFSSWILLAALLSIITVSQAYTVAPKGGGKRLSSKRWFTQGNGMSMYLPKTSPTSIKPQQKINDPTTSRTEHSIHQRAAGSSLSNSVLASCDTLPSFPTAHGLLSPETVMRMELRTANIPRSQELSHFLQRYRSSGPMSCLPMLSDPSVLPHLTEALRDIA